MHSKDAFTAGFVPEHNHGSVDYTEIAKDHVHQCLDITYPPTITQDGSHIHYTKGYVLYEKGHHHNYEAWSSTAIPVGNGMHVHYYDFETSTNFDHAHRVLGVDQAAPGTK